VTSIDEAVEEMKDTAERREHENLGTSLSIAYTSKYKRALSRENKKVFSRSNQPSLLSLNS
jgi:hypothetical protein